MTITLEKQHRKYEKYQHSKFEWIGDIPHNWESMKLKWTAKIFNGATPSSSNELFWDGDIPWYTPADIHKEDKYLGEPKRKITELGYKSCGTSLIKKGSVVVSNRAPIGLVAIGQEPFCTNQGCKGIEVTKRYSSDYLYYVLYAFSNVLDNFGNGTTFKELSSSTLKKFTIPVPSRSEQDLISAHLDKKTELVDLILLKKKQQIKLLKEKRASLINKAVTGGLDDNVEMKDSHFDWLPEFNKNWDIYSLKRIVDTPITDGPHETPALVEEGIPFISVEAVNSDGTINFERRRGNITEKLHREYCRKCKPQRDDVFIVKSGSTTGKIGLVEVDFEFSIWSPLALVRGHKNKALNKFLFYSLQSDYFQKQIQLFWSYGTQPNIGMNVLGNLKVIVPTVDEQEKIINYIDAEMLKIDSVINKIQESIVLLEEYKTSLISNAVTGKIKVTN